MKSTKNKFYLLGVILIVIGICIASLIFGIGSFGAILHPPVFPGKIILEPMQNFNNHNMGDDFYELQSGSSAIEKITDPGTISLIKQNLSGEISSEDGRYSIIQQNILIDHTTGKTIRLPVESPASPVDDIISGTFSPDGKSFAYKTFYSQVLIVNLATEKVTDIYKGECAQYTLGLVLPEWYCAGVNTPYWIDSNTIMFAYLDGLPNSFTNTSSDSPLVVDHIMVMAKDGTVIQSFKPDYGTNIQSYKIESSGLMWNGENGIFYGPVGGKIFEHGGWLDIYDLSNNIYNLHPLPDNFAGGLLSPDGQYILKPGQPMQLYEISTQKIKSLGFESKGIQPGFEDGDYVWSPNAKYVAFLGNNNNGTAPSLLIVPLSEAQGWILLLDPRTSMSLVCWLP